MLFGKDPKNIDISNLWNFISSFETQEKTIFLAYTRKYDTYSSSGAFKLSDIKERLSFNHDDLIPIQKELNEKYAPREGYKPCAYCGKQVPTNTLVSYEIIFQDSRPDPFSRHGYTRFVNRKTNMYCSKTCGVHDQMAHEG